MAKPKVDYSTISHSEHPSHGIQTTEDYQRSTVLASLRKSIETKQKMIEVGVSELVAVANIVIDALRDGKKVALFGNGGSAADAQHIAAELVGKFKAKRPPLRAIAFTTNASILTAIGNDFSFDEIFARQVQANLEKGDVAVGISTSGQSRNVIKGIEEASRIGARTVALTGSNGVAFASKCDGRVIVPSTDTQRIQECHIMIGHLLCELVDEAFGETGPK